jgi:hypothetical protein
MADTRIRKNERCVIGLPVCDYVFSSTRTCFIAYGFSTSGLELSILKRILSERGMGAVEAGGRLEPGTFAFCTKICSQIIVSQFCIVLANNDKKRGREVANPNVHMEYGLILGHNKYVIPFQRDDQGLPFNVAPLDTIKYNTSNFETLATRAIEQAITATSQSQPAPNIDQVISLFLLIKNATLVNIQNNTFERAVYDLGHHFGFNLLVQFDGLSYIFLGNFAAFHAHAVLWRLSKLLEILDARLAAVPTRVEAGFATQDATGAVEFFIKRLKIWLVIADTAADEVKGWMRDATLPAECEVFTMTEVSEAVSKLPGLS